MNISNKNRVIYGLAQVLEANFDSSDWTKLAYEIDEIDLITNHNRLLRSLYWRDPDYPDCIFDILNIIAKNDEKLLKITQYVKLEEWLSKHRPDIFSELYEEDSPEHILEENPLDDVKFDLNKQISRIYSSLNDDPELALGTTKEMLETVMKTILSDKVENVDRCDIPELIKQIRRNLELIPQSSHSSNNATSTLNRTLSSLGQIVIGIGELRNLYGTGHGKVCNESGLKPYHAKFVVNAGVTLAKFLIEVSEDQ